VKTGKSSLTISARPIGFGAVSQRLIPTAKRFGLLMRIAVTESVSLRAGDEKLTAFVELERITHELAGSALLSDDSN